MYFHVFIVSLFIYFSDNRYSLIKSELYTYYSVLVIHGSLLCMFTYKRWQEAFRSEKPVISTWMCKPVEASPSLRPLVRFENIIVQCLHICSRDRHGRWLRNLHSRCLSRRLINSPLGYTRLHQPDFIIFLDKVVLQTIKFPPRAWMVTCLDAFTWILSNRSDPSIILSTKVCYIRNEYILYLFFNFVD